METSYKPVRDERARSTCQSAALAAVAVAWLFLMTYDLGGRSLHVDEVITACRSQAPASPPDPMHPATYYAYVRFWTNAVGTSDAALRSSSLVPAVVALVFFCGLALWLLPWPAWFVAVLLACFSTELLLYWRMARYFSASAAAFSIVMIGAVGYLMERRTSWLIALVIGTVGAALVDYIAAAGTATVWAWLIVTELRAKAYGRAAAVFGSAIVAAALSAPVLRPAWAGAQAVMDIRALRHEPRSFALAAAVSGWGLLASECLPPWQPAIAFPTVAASGLLLAIGAGAAWKQGGPWKLIVCVWPIAVAIALLLVFLTPGEPPVRAGSRALYAMPCMFLVMGLGWSASWRRWWGKGATIVIAVGWSAALLNYFSLRGYLNPQYALRWQPVAEFIAQHARPGDAVVTAFDSGFHRYYHGPGLQLDVSGRGTEFAAAVETVRNGGTVWLIARDRGSRHAVETMEALRQRLRAQGASEVRHEFFHYGPAELAWRRLTDRQPAPAYVTVFELWKRSQGTGN
ncbi:MAG: hypothetical protein H5T86_11690 [Armatimonadetes bacterium]|nr:hypothetical protein [Armatimonadota bacterium]